MTELLDDTLGIPELLGAISVLGLVVAELYRRQAASSAKVAAKLDKCEERHEAREKEMREMSGRLGRLEGEQEGVRGLAKQVLEIVASRK